MDGVLICDLRVDDARVRALEEFGLPAVVVGGPDGVGSLANVWDDNAAGVVETVEYLVALGHRRIARVGGLPDLRHTLARGQAWQEVCQRLDLAPAVTETTDYSGEQGAHATRRLLSAAPRPTAILYDNDVMAIAGLAVAQEMGLSVPGDLSLVAFDDSPLCRLVHPPLTTLTRDIPAYGALAARHLLDVVEGVAEQPSRQADTARLTPRGSTARPHPATA